MLYFVDKQLNDKERVAAAKEDKSLVNALETIISS